MNLHYIFVLVFCQLSHGHPRGLNRPQIDFSPPEEVNEHLQRKHFTRSISTNQNHANSLEQTIAEVEDLIKADPKLPRLTRGEIVDILENLTKEEVQRDPKAIMVVRPYTPEVDGGKDMEELYTKPPVTQIIGSEPFTSKKTSARRKTTTTTTTTEENVTEEKVSSTKKPYRGTTYFNQQSSVKKEDFLKPLNRRRPTLSTEKPNVTTYHPSRRPMRRRTTTTKHPNHKYPEESTPKDDNFVNSSGLRIIDPPKLAPSSVNHDLEMMQAQENYNKAPTHKPFKKLPEKNIEPSIEVIVPEHLKKVVSDLNLDGLSNPNEFEAMKKIEADRVKEILASIGVQEIQTTTTTTGKPDATAVADNLSPEMKELLVTFGLLADPNAKKSENIERVQDDFNPEKAEINAESYSSGFKPLPEDTSTRGELEDLLAQFGLGRSARKQKSIKKNKNERPADDLNFDVVPDAYKEVLQDIGLVERTARRIRANVWEKPQEKQHVFTPTKYNEYATIAQIEKVERLKKLMAAIQELEKLNRTITQEDMKNIDVEELKQLLSSLNLNEKLHELDEEHAPNPISFDPGVSKNEVKRQEEAKSTTTTEATTTTTTEAAGPSLKDLEDSFGGKKDTTTTPPETTTALRQTGFYYLVDWNTFLDIDNQNGTRVNLRFQPTIGDPKRFFSVNVP